MAISNPPINDRFLTTGIIWKGIKWKIIVVGIKKIKSKEQASLVLSEKINRITPLIKRAVAKINKIIAAGSGNPLLTIYSVWLLKFIIFPGIALTKIELSKNLPRKFSE